MPIHKVGFIGLGIMGKSMAGDLLAGGHEPHVFNSSRAKADAANRTSRWSHFAYAISWRASSNEGSG
jgi:3-hydroxyisobutyrate dehydrogenase-like beta-hydroxyacid dehydrogenase